MDERRKAPVAKAYRGCRSQLLRCKVLVIAEVYHVLEHGRARRQVRRVQEQGVKGVTSPGRTVDRGAALEHARVVFGVVHADQRAVVVESLSAPVFQVAKEVVESAIGAEVLRGAPVRNGKGDVLACRDGHAVI